MSKQRRTGAENAEGDKDRGEERRDDRFLASPTRSVTSLFVPKKLANKGTIKVYSPLKTESK